VSRLGEPARRLLRYRNTAPYKARPPARLYLCTRTCTHHKGAGASAGAGELQCRCLAASMQCCEVKDIQQSVRTVAPITHSELHKHVS
jgi:hypothetical protein